jgi:membrane fusion protein (multidrug efflux system)
MGDLSQMSLEFGLPDKLIGQIKPNDAKRVTISALEGQWQSFTGRVSEVGVAAREGGRLFKVVLKVPNPEEKLKSGMTASVHLESGHQKRANVAVVPLSALVASSTGGSNSLAVFVIKPASGASVKDHSAFEGTVTERRISTDDIIGSSIIVTEGLMTNDWIVVGGLNNIYEGASVLATPQP